MNLPLQMQERLMFLTRVVDKEIKHLDYAAEQAFGQSLTLEAVQQLDDKPELALRVEAFTSRFCRLQDTLGDKFLPALLKSLGEPERALLINLEKAEKYGWLNSADNWIALRQLRNQMIHEYIEDAKTLFDALSTANSNTDELKNFARSLEQQASKLLG